MRNVVVTGVTGQVGSYLAEHLLARGDMVHGVVRKSSTFPTERIDHLLEEPRLCLHYGDVTDPLRMRQVLEECEPDEIYHLAALSHVGVSFEMPLETLMATGYGTAVLLEAALSICPQARVYNAATSELFGNEPPPQDELTLINPRSPYGAAKAYGYHLTRVYRDAYDLFAVNGILFNQTSPRQSPTFVTRKITRGVARIVAGLDARLVLGNLDARRDFTFAGDGAAAMLLMLGAEEPDDWCVASGESHTVREVLVEAVLHATGWDSADEWIDAHVRTEARYERPLEIHELRGDASRIRKELGWAPSIEFADLVRLMVEHDLDLARREARDQR